MSDRKIQIGFVYSAKIAGGNVPVSVIGKVPGGRFKVQNMIDATHKPFTMTVVRAFVDGLATEGESSCHYVDQVLTSFSDVLDD